MRQSMKIHWKFPPTYRLAFMGEVWNWYFFPFLIWFLLVGVDFHSRFGRREREKDNTIRASWRHHVKKSIRVVVLHFHFNKFPDEKNCKNFSKRILKSKLEFHCVIRNQKISSHVNLTFLFSAYDRLKVKCRKSTGGFSQKRGRWEPT